MTADQLSPAMSLTHPEWGDHVTGGELNGRVVTYQLVLPQFGNRTIEVTGLIQEVAWANVLDEAGRVKVTLEEAHARLITDAAWCPYEAEPLQFVDRDASQPQYRPDGSITCVDALGTVVTIKPHGDWLKLEIISGETLEDHLRRRSAWR